jgi:hypothetical protein
MQPLFCQGLCALPIYYLDHRQVREELEANRPLFIIEIKTMEKKTKTVQFDKEKDTKNTVKFAEVQTQGEAPIIGSLYVQKWFAGDATKLKVTVEVQ